MDETQQLFALLYLWVIGYLIYDAIPPKAVRKARREARRERGSHG